MKYTQKELNFYESIDFFNRCIEVSKKHENNSDDTLEKIKKEIVLAIFSKLGYESKYISREKFFKVEEKKEHFKYIFWVSLKYGIVELGISAENNNTLKIITAGSFNRLQYTLGYDIDIPKLPSFKDEQELESILQEYLKIYEDFKIEFVKQYS